MTELKSLTAEESLRKLIKAAVELVIIRHLQSEEDGEELDIEFLAADTANACFGVDTCAMEPIPELSELLRRLQPQVCSQIVNPLDLRKQRKS